MVFIDLLKNGKILHLSEFLNYLIYLKYFKHFVRFDYVLIK